jgi:hypothetical protein
VESGSSVPGNVEKGGTGVPDGLRPRSYPAAPESHQVYSVVTKVPPWFPSPGWVERPARPGRELRPPLGAPWRRGAVAQVVPYLTFVDRLLLFNLSMLILVVIEVCVSYSQSEPGYCAVRAQNLARTLPQTLPHVLLPF